MGQTSCRVLNMVLLDSILQLNREIPTFSGVMSTGEGKGLKYSNVGHVAHPYLCAHFPQPLSPVFLPSTSTNTSCVPALYTSPSPPTSHLTPHTSYLTPHTSHLTPPAPPPPVSWPIGTIAGRMEYRPPAKGQFVALLLSYEKIHGFEGFSSSSKI